MKRKLYLIFTLFIFSVVELKAQNIDLKILVALNDKPNNSDKYWKTITNTVIPVTIISPATMFLYSIKTKDNKLKNKSYQAVGAVALNSILTFSLKYSIKRQRPYINNDNIYKKTKVGKLSFPSGHTSTAFATATNVTLAFPKWYVAVPAYTWAAACGYSRLYLGVHYPSDVLAGALIGTLSSLAVYKINSKITGK